MSIRSSNRKHMRGSGRRFSSRFLWIIPSGCTHVLLSVSQAPTLRQQIIYKRFYNNPRTLPFSFRSSRLFIGGRGGCLVPLCASSSCARWFIVFSNGFSPCFFCSATPFFFMCTWSSFDCSLFSFPIPFPFLHPFFFQFQTPRLLTRLFVLPPHAHAGCGVGEGVRPSCRHFSFVEGGERSR